MIANIWNMNNMEKEKQELIFGLHPVIEALKAGKELEKVFLQKGLEGGTFNALLPLLKEQSIPYQIVPKEKLNRITRKNHQGVVAMVSPIAFFNIEQIIPTLYEQGKTPFILVLDKVTDVGNFGAILRTAHSAGVDAVLFPDKNSAQLNSATIKSSAGAIFKVPICRTDHLKKALIFLKNSGLQLVAGTEKGAVDYYRERLTGPVAMMMGSEGEGISPAYLKLSDKQVKIPMLGEIASLNVSVATGILLYEVVRQRLQK